MSAAAFWITGRKSSPVQARTVSTLSTTPVDDTAMPSASSSTNASSSTATSDPSDEGETGDPTTTQGGDGDGDTHGDGDGDDDTSTSGDGDGDTNGDGDGDTDTNGDGDGDCADDADDSDSATPITPMADNMNGLLGSLCGSDTSDWYTYTLSTAGFVAAEVRFEADQDIDLYILDQQLNVVSSSTGGGTQETVHESSNAGTYFIRIDRISEVADYDVSLQVW